MTQPKTPLRFETKLRWLVVLLQPLVMAGGFYLGFALKLKGCL